MQATGLLPCRTRGNRAQEEESEVQVVHQGMVPDHQAAGRLPAHKSGKCALRTILCNLRIVAKFPYTNRIEG